VLLKLTEIDTYYGRAQTLHSVSLEVNEGEIVTVLGANGAGKSTTLLTISGIVRAKRGSILFEGRAIEREKAGRIVRMGISHCPEGRELFPEMSVQDNLRLGAFVRNDAVGIGKDLDHVYMYFPRLLERKNQMAGSLSGGEQQMLAIARALMSRPKLLLLDEPSLGLSPLLVEEMYAIIEEINRDGMAILLVEQNVGSALEVANRGYVLETGRVVFAGTKEELQGNDAVKRAYLGG
jgi:branched-chain amino acid transport system ATP-binding protein